MDTTDPADHTSHPEQGQEGPQDRSQGLFEQGGRAYKRRFIRDLKRELKKRRKSRHASKHVKRKSRR